MERNPLSTFNDQLRERTMDLAVTINRLFQSKKVNIFMRQSVYQLIRSSSSVAANTSAATRARSDAEFYAKICIVVEEVDETKFWLIYLCRVGALKEDEITDLFTETDRLVGLFSSIKKKMKDRIK